MGLATAPEAESADFFLERVAAGLQRPVFATAPPGDFRRLFIVEQWDRSVSPPIGRIRILDLATLTVQAAPFLEIPGVSDGGEGGLLGLAFHPRYATNGLFYVYYQEFFNGRRDTFLVRYQVSADPDLADPSSATAVLNVDQPQGNHNGGWLAFGPDGMLHLSLGDGGGANDSGSGHTAGIGNAQDKDNLLGTILRIDVDGDDFPADPTRNYAVPDNPFVGKDGEDEILVYGLRNPFRCSFDRATGDLYIGDVGQDTLEEIDVLPAGDSGANYGWRFREGTIATPTGGVGGAQPGDGVNPVYEYAHGVGPFQGFAVIGGYVYRGPVRSLRGRYFFADNVIPRIYSFRWDGSDPAGNDGTNFSELVDHTDTPEFTPGVGSIDSPSSFAEDAVGNLYLLDLAGGDVFRVTSTAEVPGLGPPGVAVLALLLALAGARRALARGRLPSRGPQSPRPR